MIRVELYGIARARAGCASVEIDASSLAEALRALELRCPGLVPDVLERGALRSAFLVSRNGERFVERPEEPLVPGDHLLILSGQAGG